jgi:hypothetical protein
LLWRQGFAAFIPNMDLRFVGEDALNPMEVDPLEDPMNSMEVDPLGWMEDDPLNPMEVDPLS